MIAAKWFDLCIGVDIHIVLVPTPGGPVPTPLPHPFVGLIFDPAGLAVSAGISGAISLATGTPFQGPILVNSLPAANTGTETTNKMTMPHFPTPPGVAFAKGIPDNDGIIVTGSKTVYFWGSNAVRLGDLTMTCSDPVRLPTSTIIAIPMGPPVLIGGPPAFDFLAVLMAGIRCRWVSEKLHKLLRAPQGSWRSKIICFFTGHPVDVASGMVMTDFVDFELPGPIPFKFERTYYSRSDYNGPLGYGWHHSYDQFIRLEKKRIVLKAGDGRELYFSPLKEGETTRNHSERLNLTRLREGFRVDTSDNLKFFFGAAGHADGTLPLLRIEDLNGNKISLKYDAAGRLMQLIDSAGRDLRFTIDRNDRLAALNVPDPNARDKRLDVARFEYDQYGDLTAAFDALGHAYRYAYKYHLLVQETNRNGLSFYFMYDGIDKDAWCVRTWGDGGIYDHVLIYDKQKHITVVEDSLGNQTTYFCNEAGVVVKKIDALGGITLYKWDEHCRKIAQTDPNGSVTKWEYDEWGNLAKTIDALNKATEQKYSHANLLSEIIDRRGNRWKRFYDEKGNLTATEDPLSQRWRYQTDRLGRLTRASNPSGGAFTIQYDDEQRMIKEKDWEGNVTLTETDYWERPVRVTEPDGKKMSFSYDALNQAVAMQLPDNGKVSLSYDAEGNLVRAERNGRPVKQWRYAGFHRLVEQIDAAGDRLSLKYDSEENLIEIVNEKNEACRLAYDPLKKVIEESTFDGRRIKLKYDVGGRRTKYTENSGNHLEYFYDAADQIIKKVWSDGETEQFQYDEEGEVIFAASNHCKIEFTRDAWGRVIRESRDGLSVESVYNALGLRSLRRDPWGGETSYEYDNNGDLRRVRFPNGQPLSLHRNAIGDEIRRLLPGGGEIRSNYGALGELRSREIYRANSAAPVSSWQFRYDRMLEVTAIDSSTWGLQSYKYDAVGHLLEYQSPRTRESYRYDAAGNRMLMAEGAVAYELGNRLGKFDQLDFVYDADGRIIQKQERRDDKPKAWKYFYQANGQLKEVLNSADQRVAFEYDPFGRRISKRVGDEKTSFWWDEDELLGEEANDHKKRFWYDHGFGPDDYAMEPIAVEDPAGLLFCLCDQVGTPRELFSGEGDLDWTADLHPWGRLEELRGTLNLNPLRFPGQYHDCETGLHYNRFRYYDPDVGRYIMPDPAGLYGGLNEYAYGINPISWIDPFGLAPFEQSHSFSKYLLRAIQGSGRAFQGMPRLPGQTTVRLGRHVHRAFHEAFERILPQGARHVGAARIADLIRRGRLSPARIANALERAARQSLRRGSQELADTLAEIRRVRRCGGF
jgi:RHS repeat-associated protein